MNFRYETKLHDLSTFCQHCEICVKPTCANLAENARFRPIGKKKACCSPTATTRFGAKTEIGCENSLANYVELVDGWRRL